MRGNIATYQPMIKFSIQLESGHSWGDLSAQAQPITESLKLIHSFKWVGCTLNRKASTINFTCWLKGSASLALAEHRINEVLAKHVIGVTDEE